MFETNITRNYMHFVLKNEFFIPGRNRKWIFFSLISYFEPQIICSTAYSADLNLHTNYCGFMEEKLDNTSLNKA